MGGKEERFGAKGMRGKGRRVEEGIGTRGKAPKNDGGKSL
tara:strand:- start:81 stop:200 length:120 start_codon:yes stop_codon:yes gene_type:complete